MKKIILIGLKIGVSLIFCAIAHISLVGRPVLAAHQEGLDVSGSFAIADSNAVDGDVLISSTGGFVRAKTTYDSNIFGVLSDRPLVVFRSPSDASTSAIVRNGVTLVNVVVENGAIVKGDYLTSSNTAGKAMKATQSGYVLGVALGDFSGQGVGRVPVAIRIEYAELTTARNANRLFELLGASFLTNVKDPEKFGTIVRYILAGLVLLASLSFGFITFSRSVPKGIEAIGRNPLAKNTIYFSMALNVGLVAIVGILGIVGSLLILRF